MRLIRSSFSQKSRNEPKYHAPSHQRAYRKGSSSFFGDHLPARRGKGGRGCRNEDADFRNASSSTLLKIKTFLVQPRNPLLLNSTHLSSSRYFRLCFRPLASFELALELSPFHRTAFISSSLPFPLPPMDYPYGYGRPLPSNHSPSAATCTDEEGTVRCPEHWKPASFIFPSLRANQLRPS